MINNPEIIEKIKKQLRAVSKEDLEKAIKEVEKELRENKQ